MKSWIAALIRIGVCLALSLPTYFLGMQGLVTLDFAAYIAAVLIYWSIQLITGFRHPLDGAFVVALLSCLFAFFMPALARMWHIHPL